VIGAAAAIALVLSIGLLYARRVVTAMRICALQALVVAVVLGATTAIAGILAVVANGVALPLAIARVRSPPTFVAGGETVLSTIAALAAPLAIMIVFVRLGVGERAAVGSAVALLGLVLLGLRTHPLAPALGLLSSQNGLVLIASAHPDLSEPAVLAAVLPSTAVLVLAETWLRR
jgi:hypothetical protein